jgi:hypothetical protein
MSKYVIEKDVPIPPAKRHGIYAYNDVPFDQMEVDDCVKILLTKLIPDNLHPDARERANALACLSSYLKRKYPDKAFTYRTDTPVKTHHFRTQKEEVKQANLNRYVRVWRTK